MPGSAQLSPAVVGIIQWTLVVIELLVIAYVAAWIVRHTRLRDVLRWRVGGRLGALLGHGAQRPTLLSAAEEEAAAVEGAGEAAATRLRRDGTAGSRTPTRPMLLGTRRRKGAHLHEPVTDPRPIAPAAHAVHCPRCGSLLQRAGATAPLLTRCPGCGRRVSVRHDATKLVVTIEDD